ncbi:MAG: class I SAM-dependent methyltransferase [Planctomycetota bacterium]|nr:class I SAM-dependent methyltransferase [Planctomycetota bacterium]
MSAADRDKWNQKYHGKQPLVEIKPDDWLRECVDQIASEVGTSDEVGQSIPLKAVEFACGLGANSIWLAQHGWDITAMDVSAVGLERAKQTAHQVGAEVNWIAADVEEVSLANQQFELAVVFRFLDRERLPQLIDSVIRPGGWLIYETFSTAQLERTDSHIHNADFTLREDELPLLYPQFDVLSHKQCVLPDRTVMRFHARKK